MNTRPQTITIENQTQLLLFIMCLGKDVMKRIPEMIENRNRERTRDAFNQNPQEAPQDEPQDADSPFGDTIHTYTRREAIDDGLQFNAHAGELAEVTRQHTNGPIYFSQGVNAILAKVKYNKRASTDIKGTWHDILSVMFHHVRYSKAETSYFYFQVKIIGAGRQQLYTLKAEMQTVDIDDSRPCIMISLPDED